LDQKERATENLARDILRFFISSTIFGFGLKNPILPMLLTNACLMIVLYTYLSLNYNVNRFTSLDEVQAPGQSTIFASFISGPSPHVQRIPVTPQVVSLTLLPSMVIVIEVVSSKVD
jgi:hypothetical protein